MRMTNKIMQNNSLYNINNNKVLQDKLSTQMSTQKKITRPSDDPVIAIRALRLRSDVSQIKQYYEKNAPDAESWLKVTADALNTTTSVIEDMLEQCTKGSNKDLGVEQLDIIVTQLKSLKSEFYATGNVDYAGRYVFAGYRTDTTLTYTENKTENFEITEQLDISALDTINYTSIGDLKGISSANYDPETDGAIADTTIKNNDIYRIRLSYDSLKDGVPSVTKYDAGTDAYVDVFPSVTTMSSTANPNPYDYIVQNPDAVVLVPETGELLIGADAYDDYITGAVDSGQEIRVTYEKDSWKDGDLRPQHYFACTYTDSATGKTIDYNEGYLTDEGASQIIQYDVGYNQKIRINTTADEVFTLDVDRNIDDLESALAALKEIGEAKTNLDNMLDGMTEGEAGYDELKATADAADKAYTYIRENIQKMFEGLITKVNGTLDNTSVAITDNGTRGSRLDLITNRLMTQKTTFQTLQSANEDVDITEVTIQLTSMNYSYQSALLATSKIMQNSLMNYI
ncbi:flagellar hook-associated protein FlgL [Kineothrix sedimenti]|uniref:Flagellar hook-associated protein FlgL n=1 Tax=Kineothrix sedimenti TaxID=3123317 RepID=A0ABZ3EZN2_9FIRM